ncbi:cell division cycle-associated protein 3-like [Sciurus carolinensis]|uniref:cell division cycle-associated protein 3-like n=1 Tax=Sciurus carolinensis TaxID=30640 RepID=UPI001FB4E3FD|nr:cell division cycle-associated protein 3-like [Sciurus carolinensis]
MKTSSADFQSPLVKELGEVFENEASKSNLTPESVLTLGVTLSSELDLPLTTQLSLEDQMLPWNDPQLPFKQVSSLQSARHPTESPVARSHSDNPSKDPESP